MSNADFYEHDVDSTIQIVQTHISWVVLTGPFAYKIKKPADLGFLDFTTLEKRRHYCQEELRLNQAFAPDLYLEVVPIYKINAHFSFRPEGEIVEYAVRMRQFDQADMLINLFERGEFAASLAERLGERIAEIHKNAPVVDQTTSFGTPQAMAESVRMNFDTIRSFVGTVIPQNLFNAIQSFMYAFIEKNGWLFDLRVKENRIKECHGDLHMRNICLYKGHVELFDRIEFNDAFKNIDVMYDLAFLLMDLKFRDSHRLANRILNTYIETTGDYQGVILLPFFQSVRALIRGEVALLTSADENVEPDLRSSSKFEGLRYLNHAFEYTRKASGSLIVVCGLSGSGKSTFSKALADQKNFLHIRSDAVRKHLAGVDLYGSSQEIYSHHHTSETYAKLIELGIVLAERGHSVILDAKFDRREFRDKLREKAASFGLSVHFVHCDAPAETLKTRLSQRTKDISDATEQHLDAQRKQFEAFSDEEKMSYTLLDTTDQSAIKTAIQTISDQN
jgi:hypothetical protein